MADLSSHIRKHWPSYVLGAFGLLFVFILMGIIMSFVGVGGSSKSLGLGSMNDVAYSQNYERGNSYYYESDGSFAPDVVDRKVIKNANLNLETDRYDYAKSEVRKSVDLYGAILMSENENKYNDYRSINYQIKVPAEKLDSFVDDMKKNGEVLSLNVGADDVTGTYADYTDRLERYNLQIVRYEEMLKDSHIDIEEEIQVQTRIDQLEDQIFYIEGRLNSIDEKSEYSNVYLTLREEPAWYVEIDFLGLSDGLKLFVESLSFGVRAILLLLGFLLPFGVVYSVYRLARKFF